MGWLRDLLRRSGRGVAVTTRAAGELAERHQGAVARGTQAGVSATGAVTEATGRTVEAMGDALASLAAKGAHATDSRTLKVAARTAQGVSLGVRLVGSGTRVLGRLVRGSGRTVGDVVAGGTVTATKGGADLLDSASISADDIERLRSRIRRYGKASLQDAAQFQARLEDLVRARQRQQVLESLTVGGVSLAEALRAGGQVDGQLVEAYTLAYPGLASQYTFAQAVDRFDTASLAGFVAGLKGKLFELHLVEHLNESVLPEGYSAALAPAANQAGWDLRVSGPDGALAQLVQAKATESASYVREALERYPDIDVYATTEVYAELAARGLAEGVRASGLSEASLEAAVEAGVDVAGGTVTGIDLLPAGVGMAVLGLSVFMDGTVAKEIRAREAGRRMGHAVVPVVLGKSVLVATQVWWLGVIVGAGASWLAGAGRAKRAQFDALHGVVDTLAARA